MGQSSYIYILWVVILGAGLWIIISFGSLLHAREDLAGDWDLTPERPASGEKPSSMHVDQSGQYLILLLPGKRLSMKMTEERVVDEKFGEHKRVVLQGDGSTATFEGRTGGDLWRLSLGGAMHGDFVARLSDRTYPRAVSAVRQFAQSTPNAR
jgi:hypothetical protein